MAPLMEPPMFPFPLPKRYGNLFEDDFGKEANVTAPRLWTPYASSSQTFVVNKHRLTWTAPASWGAFAWTPLKGHGMYAEASGMLTSAGQEFSVSLRGDPSGAGGQPYAYMADMSKTELRIFYKTPSSATVLASRSFSPNVTKHYILAGQAIGQTVTLFVNGARMLQVTDANLAEGFAGLSNYSGTVEFDWFRAVLL